MKSSEMAVLLDQADEPKPGQVCASGTCDGEESGELYDEEDFWEALDLLETSRKFISQMLKYGNDIGAVRRHLGQNLCDDIGQFIGTFIDLDEAEHQLGPRE